MTTSDPGPANPKPKSKMGIVAGIVAGIVMLACCGIGISAITDNSSTDTSSTDNSSTSATPAGPSDDQVKDDALAYKACPDKQGDTLKTILAAVFTIAHDTPKGTSVIDRSGDRARIAAYYVEVGQEKETDFDYDLKTHEVTGADSVAVHVLEALKAECPSS